MVDDFAMGAAVADGAVTTVTITGGLARTSIHAPLQVAARNTLFAGVTGEAEGAQTDVAVSTAL